MIDINEGDLNELLDRLEAAEKERDALRAKIEVIQLTELDGRTHAIHPDAIARLVEPGTHGKWLGINCYVRTFDNVTIEARESVSLIMELIKSCYDLTEKGIPNLRAEIDRLKVENATYIKTLLEIADWDGVWGPFPETNERWRGMAVVRAREATKSFKHGDN